jgi:hypothetical protein
MYGDKTNFERTGMHTSCVERTNLTSRHMNGWLMRKTLGYSKQVEMLEAACIWEDAVYNFTRPLKTLRSRITLTTNAGCSVLRTTLFKETTRCLVYRHKNKENKLLTEYIQLAACF